MAQINKPSDYFNTKLHTGNGSTQSINGIGFQPDLVWIKARSGTHGTQNHRLFDAVRGATKELYSDLTDSEATVSTGLTSFDSDGYSLSTSAGVNGSSTEYVGWNWLASNTTASNTDGSITSTVSANTTNGFSIVSYTGTGSNATVGHGLGSTLSMIIQKNLTTGTHAWNVYHKNLTSAGYNLNLDGTYAEFTSATTWNSTAPTSSVFSVGTDTNANESGSGHIAYCFAEKKGFSKFGSYTGNGSTDGTFVYTGFKPAFMIIKRTDSTNNWKILDNKRSPFNVNDKTINADDSGAEGTETNSDFLSNGFKLRRTGFDVNGSGASYIYMCFAESPLVGTNNTPATAR